MSDFFPMLRNNSLFPDDRFFRNFFSDFPEKSSSPALDIRDEGNHFLLEADMPGFTKDDLKVNYKNNVLTIQAQKTEETEERKEDRYMIRERRSSSFSRQVIVENIDEGEIKGSMENGVLKIILPKKTPNAAPDGRDIEIK